MNHNKIQKDIKESVIRNFSFLKSYGFKNFTENQLSYEFHFETKNNHIKIDIWFEAIYSTPIWIKINQYHFDYLEIENQILKDCKNQRSLKYDNLFELYLKNDDSHYLDKIKESYNDGGKVINELYLKECSKIIKRNIGILFGELESLKLNTEIVQKKKELLKSNKKIKHKTYTLEYEIFDCDAYREFSSLEELNSFIKKNQILKYRILDWNMDVIKK